MAWHMTPGTSARLGNRSSDSHICSPTTTTDLNLRFLPGLLANHEMAKTVDPGAPENLYAENAFKAALLKRTRAQRIPFRPGVHYSNKGRIHSRRPILSFSFFACKTAADHTFRIDGQNEAAGAADARFWPYTEAMGWIRSFYRLCLTKYQLLDYQQAAIENP